MQRISLANTRGLILDADKGDFVKVGNDGKVIRASHGTSIMDDAKMTEEYGEKRQWSPFESFLGGMKKKGNFLRSATFRMFENFFDMPAMLLCARLIDIMDTQDTGKEKYKLIWPDVLSSLIVNFDYSSFGDNKGYFYPALKADIAKYIKPTSKKLKEWLKKLRNNGKKVFLITNSQADFSMFVLENAFGADWRSYFDVAISRAEKPGFFRDKNPFVEVVNRVNGKDPIQSLEADKYYALGNSSELEEYLCKLTGKTEMKILFFGDSLLSDVYPPKCFANWQTVALLEELELEIDNEVDGQNDNVNNGEDCADDEPDTKKQKLNEDTNGRQKDDHITSKDILTSATWGSIFGVDGKLMNTLYSSLIDEYSSLVIAGLDSITELPLDHTFEKSRHNGRTHFFPREPTTS
ncbi:5'-nucleotidase domain-containing protein 1-like isoform X2 [Dendronephthya gigantea]|uniref:5'-nucleotidase domain-containing protein 1-like isoform X2 n=1 Tax=Dendronephthya gigantea TaxID=151771 RepID=UPI0010694A21|nr:5'-nucleotidase domain-containing protein 1-like isoform X2 [Dendronephthya gigantea]